MKKILFIFLLAFLLLSFSVFSYQTNSSSYKQNVIVSVGGESVNSSSYKTSLAIGIISRIINSTSYINKLGFFYTWKLATGQSCTAADQCEGNFCCSNLCASSACASSTPTTTSSGGGGGAAAAGGGGGGGGPLPTPIEKKKDFDVSPGSIKEQLALGTAKTKSITIKNTGEAVLSFNLAVNAVSDFVFLSDSGFSLGSGEEKAIEANIIGKKLGSYIGEIEASADGIKKSISIIIEVESEQVLFDAKLDIPSGYKEVQAGDELKTQITLLNVGPPRKVDVTATYIIKDNLGNAVYQSTETFAVEKQTSFVKPFKIPKELKPGDYLAIIELRYENSFAVSSELFRVVPKGKGIVQRAAKSNAVLMSILALFVGFAVLFVYLMLPKSARMDKPKGKSLRRKKAK
ncbi:hypothetical protein HYX08_05635 [Candidatus Woesearchaeota archaeon]|nr:hypothetical protein [Candidatus Woesearchaeota archaeon]